MIDIAELLVKAKKKIENHDDAWPFTSLSPTAEIMTDLVSVVEQLQQQLKDVQKVEPPCGGIRVETIDDATQVLQWYRDGVLQSRIVDRADSWLPFGGDLVELMGIMQRDDMAFREEPQPLVEGWVNLAAEQPARVLHLCRENAIKYAGSACTRVAVHMREVE